MKKLGALILSVAALSPSAFASESKRHLGGTIISVSTLVKPAPVTKTELTKSEKLDLFEYGVEEKGITKSQKEYREFLSIGSYSKMRSIGGNSYQNVGGGGGGGYGRARAIYSKPYNTPRTLSTAGFATINNRGLNRSLGGRGGRGGGFATLSGRR